MRKPAKWIFVNVSFRALNRYGELLEESSRSIEVSVSPFSYSIAREKAIRILKGVLKRQYQSDIIVEIGLVTFQPSPRESQLSLFPSP
jgi:hypothetical protein